MNEPGGAQRKMVAHRSHSPASGGAEPIIDCDERLPIPYEHSRIRVDFIGILLTCQFHLRFAGSHENLPEMT